MMKHYAILYSLIFVCNADTFAEEERSILESLLVPFRLLKLTIFKHLRDDANSDLEFLKTNNKLQKIVADDVPFPCNLTITARSKKKPSSVHKLRPGDIDIIGAIGDSLTAAWGISAVHSLTIFHEERGRAFPIGQVVLEVRELGANFLTIPNMLKEFKPNFVGYSLRASISIDRTSQFHVAEGGAIFSNVPYMTKKLPERIKLDKRANIEKD